MGAKALPKGDKGKQKLAELYADPRYIAEKKFDGSRYTIQVDGKGNYFVQSRRESVHGGMCDKTANVPHIISELKKLDLPNNTILDGEIDVYDGRDFHYVQGCMGSLPERAIATQQSDRMLYYKVFDVLEFHGENLRNKVLFERGTYLDLFLGKEIKEPKYIVPVKWYFEKDKRELFDKEIEAGAEGIMLKNLDSIYVEDKKPTDTWVKVKRNNTYDGVITGYIEGNGKYEHKLGALIISQYVDKKLIEVATISGFTDELRDEFKRRLDNKEKNIVVEFDAQEAEEISHRYRHPRFLRERKDKNISKCIYGES